MEIYFNPYPDAAQTIEKGLKCTIEAADAFEKLNNEINKQLSLYFSQVDSSYKPSGFVIVRDSNSGMDINSFIYDNALQKEINFLNGKNYKEKLLLLLTHLSKGKVITSDEINMIDNWVVSVMEMPAPVLELAAKKDAIAFTIPTEDKWRINKIHFTDRTEFLHNLWGQEDISDIVTHCQKFIKNNKERFETRYNAYFCPGALTNAPNVNLWEKTGFFAIMDRAKKRDYQVDDNLIKNVGHTKYGTLLELRFYGSGYRLFFAYIKGRSPEILAGGFYEKGIGDTVTQNKAIKTAGERIDKC